MTKLESVAPDNDGNAVEKSCRWPTRNAWRSAYVAKVYCPEGYMGRSAAKVGLSQSIFDWMIWSVRFCWMVRLVKSLKCVALLSSSARFGYDIIVGLKLIKCPARSYKGIEIELEKLNIDGTLILVFQPTFVLCNKISSTTAVVTGKNAFPRIIADSESNSRRKQKVHIYSAISPRNFASRVKLSTCEFNNFP